MGVGVEGTIQSGFLNDGDILCFSNFHFGDDFESIKSQIQPFGYDFDDIYFNIMRERWDVIFCVDIELL